MNDRITDPSSTDKPLIGSLNLNQEEMIEEIYNNYDYDFTFKKLIVLITVILFLIGTLYCVFFILDFGTVPAKSISVGKVNVLPNNMLTFQLKSNDYYLDGQPDYKIIGKENSIIYFTVKQPIIPRRILHNQASTDSSYGEYQIDIKDISAVYYVGKTTNDKVLIWQR